MNFKMKTSTRKETYGMTSNYNKCVYRIQIKISWELSAKISLHARAHYSHQRSVLAVNDGQCGSLDRSFQIRQQG
jgi:hypothetical protein